MSLLSWTSAIWESDNTKAIGHYPAVPIEASMTTMVPYIADGPQVLNAVVPVGKRWQVKSILLSASGPWQQTTTPPQNTGTFTLLVDAATKAEWRTMDSGWALGGAVTRYKETTLGRGFFGPVSIGAMTFASGAQFIIRLTPVNADMPKVVHAWLYGKDAVTGQQIMQKARAIIYGATTDILTYTAPANGFVLKEFGAEGWHNDQNLIGYIRCDVNGRPVLEVPFMYANDSLSKPPTVVMNFGDGLTFSDGDVIEVTAANVFQMGCRYVASIHAMESIIGGAGGGLAARVIGSPVIRRIGP